jgi:hypothetical protein
MGTRAYARVFCFDGIGIEAISETFIMPKDIHGKFHPGKGKPSDTRKEETNEELRDELMGEDTSQQAGGARIEHPNRNTNKKHDKQVPRDQQQQDGPKHGRTGREVKSETGEVIGEMPAGGGGSVTGGGSATGGGSTDGGGSAPGGGSTTYGSSATGGGSAAGNRIETIEAKDLRSAFVELAKYPADVCVSIYMVDTGWEDGAPLKSALRDARKQMDEMGIVGVIDKILEPAAWLAKDVDFWRSQPKGMALFLAPDYHALVSLPYDPGNAVHVHTSFILAPLTPMISGEGDYFVLALSKHRAQLYRGNGYNLQAVEIPEMPYGEDDVIQTQEKNIGGMRHGDEEKKNLELYFQEVDRTLQTAGLATEHIPLLLVGVDYELSMFRKVTKYKKVLTSELSGNYDTVPLSTLAGAAHEQIAAHFESVWREKVQHHLDKGTAPVTSFPQDVIRAAFEGRVAQLFLAKGVLLWGKYGSAPVEPVIHTEEEPGDDCLTNQLVVQTILHGGQAIVEDREKMPVEGEMVAVLRYS